MVGVLEYLLVWDTVRLVGLLPVGETVEVHGLLRLAELSVFVVVRLAEEVLEEAVVQSEASEAHGVDIVPLRWGS